MSGYQLYHAGLLTFFSFLACDPPWLLYSVDEYYKAVPALPVVLFELPPVILDVIDLGHASRMMLSYASLVEHVWNVPDHSRSAKPSSTLRGSRGLRGRGNHFKYGKSLARERFPLAVKLVDNQVVTRTTPTTGSSHRIHKKIVK
ncbi:hypothetical protein BDR04DRAFT_1119717 [Suillus decipiens]|nr:hypothetical protein BDR04DRAFT_1119717 [Suillus decipiens]